MSDAVIRRAFVTGGSGFVGGALIRRLVADGVEVRALARSAHAVETVTGSGAVAVRGDLEDRSALRSGAEGSDVVFHAAAKVEDFGDPDAFHRVNVEGTRNAVDAARAAGAPRFVHVGTEAALMAGTPLRGVDETAPLRPDSPVLYSRTKAQAEAIVVRSAVPDVFVTVSIRPRFVWGPGDTTVLPQFADAVRAGQFAWVAGGRHLTDTTHVDNVVEGLLLGARRGAAGRAYFVTDGPPVEFRAFVTALLRTQGLEPPDRSIPQPVATAAAIGGEAAWRLLRRPGAPPLTRFALWAMSQECTLDTSRAREELGYVPVITREDGLVQLSPA